LSPRAGALPPHPRYAGAFAPPGGLLPPPFPLAERVPLGNLCLAVGKGAAVWVSWGQLAVPSLSIPPPTRAVFCRTKGLKNRGGGMRRPRRRMHLPPCFCRAMTGGSPPPGRPSGRGCFVLRAASPTLMKPPKGV